MYAHQMGSGLSSMINHCYALNATYSTPALLVFFPGILQQSLRQHSLSLMGGGEREAEGGYGSQAPPLALPAVVSSVRFVVACLPWEQSQTTRH